MKKAALTLVLAGFAAALPSAVSGQTANGTVSATAVVQGNLTVTVLTNLDFGSMVPGNGSTVSPGGAPAAGTSLGELRVDHNSQVQVAAAVPGNLTHTNSVDVLPVTLECGYASATQGALDVAGPGACNALGNIAHPGNGSAATTYVQVGGAIAGADTAGALPGTYSANVVFTFTSIL